MYVEGIGDFLGFSDFLGDFFDVFYDVGFEVGRREDEGSVIGVDISLFDVFVDGVDDEFIVRVNIIDINFLGIFNEFGDDNGMVRGDIVGSFKFIFEVGFVVDDSYGSIGKDVIGMNKDGVVNFFSEFFSFGDRGEFFLSGLIDIDVVEDFREFLMIFGFVDIFGVGIEDFCIISFLEMEGDVLGKLVIDGDDNIGSVFEFVDIYNMFIV